MKLTFHGAAQTTTGSMHLLEVGGKNILLDCGLYQGRRKEAFERNRNLPIDPPNIDACLVSHAHIDHSGNLPTLVKKGFRGPIFTTPATRDLCAILLLDSAHLQDRDIYYVNKRRQRQGKRPFEPLYDGEDVLQTVMRFEKRPYEKTFPVVPGVRATFADAGHILGSASITLDIEEDGHRRRLLFTGDMGRRDMPVINDPVVVKDIDILITESTYGNRLHPEHEDVKESLYKLCQHIDDNKSRLLIPAFSVGRTQRILYRLEELWAAGRLPDIPVYVDSPLSVKATRIYEMHPECYDPEMAELVKNQQDPFSFGRLKFITRPEDSRALNTRTGPMIIISASGMCEGGRILHHLQHTVENEKNAILITGYQAEHTLGRRLINRANPIKIFGEEFNLRCQVHSIQALSAHADKQEMLAYFQAMGSLPTQTFIVHGEPKQQEPFALALKELGMGAVNIPAPGDQFNL